MDDQAMAELSRRWDEREARLQTAILESKTDHIADNAWLCWSKGELRFFLVESPIWLEREEMRKTRPDLYAELMALTGSLFFGRFNAYVRFPKLPVVAPGIHGIISYVPVHGGVTYCQQWWDGSVTYGFDTAHAISADNPEIINDVNWLMAEAESLARGIQIAARFEPYYLNAGDDNMRKARVLNRMGRFLPMEDFNMSVMLNLLRGEL